MSLKYRPKNFLNFSVQAKWMGFIAATLLLYGCVPVVETVYKAPEIQGILVHFQPDAPDQFVPVTEAKIYHQSYPETAVYSSENGNFLLPPVSQTEINLLMPAHALGDYPIVIEKGNLKQIYLARGTLLMRSLEKIDLGSLIVPQHINTQDIDSDSKSNWPCDFAIIQSLDQATGIAQRLHTAVSNEPLKSDAAYAAFSQHYDQSQHLLGAARGSCRWSESSGDEQYEYRLQAHEYFSKIHKTLKNINPAG